MTGTTHPRNESELRWIKVAAWKFGQRAGAAVREIARLELWQDWRQAQAAAAWEAEVLGLEGKELLRFLARRAYAALRDMGFRARSDNGQYWRRELTVAWDADRA